MTVNLTSDGFLHIRYMSTETKPNAGAVVEAYDNKTKGRIQRAITQGDEAFEIDTGEVYIMGTTAWEVL